MILLDKAKWKKLIDDINKVMANLPNSFKGDDNCYPNTPIEICGWEGKGKPLFNMDEIAFNGREGVEDLSHESCIIPRKYDFKDLSRKQSDWKNKGEIFDFCKTARKPYSFLVEVVLLLMRYHFPQNFKVSSDGDEEDWKFSKDYFGKMFPKYAVVLKLSGD